MRFVVPTGNFGDILAGYFAKRMGLPVEKLVIATNENDILDRFWKSGHYEKKPVHGRRAEGGLEADGVKAHEEGVKETLSPAMDILVSSNFERLLWFLAYNVYGTDASSVQDKRKIAGDRVRGWLNDLKTADGFGVEQAILAAASADFESERVSDAQTLETIRATYEHTAAQQGPKAARNNGTAGTLSAAGNYILDPHSAIGIAAAKRSVERAPEAHHISLATAHPAKFSQAVQLALKDQKDFDFATVLPEQFVGLEEKEKRVTVVSKSEGLAGIRSLVVKRVEEEKTAASA